MRTLFFILLASILSASCFAQTSDNDTLKFDLKKKTLGNIRGMNQYPPLNERKIFDEDLSAKDKPSINKANNFSALDSSNLNLNIYVPSFYQGPAMDTYLSNSLNPYANDYRYYGTFGISDNSWISSYSARDTHLTVGSLSEIRAMYNYAVSDNFIVSGGTYIAKYHLGQGFNRGKIYNDAGVNAAFQYRINDRIILHGFGRYSGFAKKHGLDAVDRWDMMPTTNYGGAFEYKVTDRFGVMGGMSRELNPMNGKWKNVPFIMPVFYGK